MRIRDIGGMALVLGGAAGTVLGAALLADSAAHADPLPPNPTDFYFHDASGPATDVTDVNLWPLFASFQEKIPYTVYDEMTNDVLGTYNTQLDILRVLPLLTISSQEVIDSSGAAPDVGTEVGGVILGFPIFIGLWGQINLLESYYAIDPDGEVRSLVQAMFLSSAIIGNYFEAGPDGISDSLIFFGTTEVPIFDIPF